MSFLQPSTTRACVAFQCFLVLTCLTWAVLGAPTMVEAQPSFRGAYDAYAAAPPMRGPRVSRARSGLRVAGLDVERQVPTLLIGNAPLASGHVGANTAARRAAIQLAHIAPLYGLDAHSLRTAELVLARPTLGGGALAVFRQRVDGVEVFETRASLLLDAHGALRAAGGQLRPVSPRPYRFAHDSAFAVTSALADAWARPAPRTALVTPKQHTARGSRTDAYFVPSSAARAQGYVLDAPARARFVLYPMPTHLVPAVYVELWIDDAARGSILVAYVVSVDDGTVLARRLLTEHDSFAYTVYANDTAPFQPFDSPFGDTSPDVAGAPVTTLPAFVARRAVEMEGFNDNPLGMPDPWLPTDAAHTSGNNVFAYADLVAPDGYNTGDLRAALTSPGVFDHAFDPTADALANEAQRSAAITQLFYTNNWLHDYFYDVGFTELAGNAQADNFGRGGEQGDPIRAESMDYRGNNNADMSTPADGSSPRMQMYLYSGVNDSGVIVGATTYSISTASFGPSSFDLTFPTTLVDDGAGSSDTDGCEAITADLTGRIALIDRGSCTFGVKVLHAQDANARGVIIMNDRAAATTLGGTPASTVTIPAVMVSQADGAILRGTALGMATRMLRESGPRPESSVDATISVHEWGHYLHRRLVAGDSAQRSAESEGWGDVLALTMLSRPTDDLGRAYPVSGYANQHRRPIYYGSRRAPYSTSPDFNALSFRHISDGAALPTTHPIRGTGSANSEVHNAGEIWVSMMFDAFAALVDRSSEPGAPYSFEEARARYASYVVLGMQLAPRSPTYTEQRDAILAAALEGDAEDARRMAMAFAGRGAGTCARSPSRYSTDLVGVVEDFTVGQYAVLEGLELEPGPSGEGRLCDEDGWLDGGEDGVVRVTVHNAGIVALSGVTLTVDADDAAVLFPLGASWAVTDLEPGESEVISVPVALEETAAVDGFIVVRAAASGGALCAGALVVERFVMDRDFVSSTVESFDVSPTWLVETDADGAPSALGVWSVGVPRLGTGGYVLRAVDTSSITDTAVELPEVTASSSESLVLSFAHHFSFEESDGTFYDGGVIEISTDGGSTWTDVDAYVDPGYSGMLSDTASSPLALRPAYSGENPSSPAADLVALDFGMAFAGTSVRFRFRVGTDQAIGGDGWEIDDVEIAGATAPVFTALAPDESVCPERVTPDGGVSSEVDAGMMGADGGMGTADAGTARGTLGGGGGCGCRVTAASARAGMRWAHGAWLLGAMLAGRRMRRRPRSSAPRGVTRSR